MSANPGPMELIVPYVRGGGSDQRARLAAEYFARHIGRKVSVVNRTGAVTGHTAIAAASPDGDTIGLITGEIGMMHWHPGLTDLTWRDYTPLSAPFVESAAVIVGAASPHRTLADFLEACRRGPVRGSGGPHFSVWKFALAGLLQQAGIGAARLAWTETLSGEQGLENVMAGRADVAPITLTDARGPLDARKARALATMEDQRHARFADVPTVREAIGVAWSVAHWRGFVAPAGLPEGLRDHYVEAFRCVERDPGFLAAAAAQSFTLRWRHGDAFAAYMAEDDAQFGPVIRALGADAGSVSSLL